jgi:hypothetical protein
MIQLGVTAPFRSALGGTEKWVHASGVEVLAAMLADKLTRLSFGEHERGLFSHSGEPFWGLCPLCVPNAGAGEDSEVGVPVRWIRQALSDMVSRVL